MRIPWVSAGIGVLVWLLTGSIVAGLVTFISIHILLLVFVAILVALAKEKSTTSYRRFK